MTEKIKRMLRDSPAARWTVLALVSFTMLTGYVVSDVMSPLDTLLQQNYGWTLADFGTFNLGYGLFNVFLFMLIIGGMILDKAGSRATGVIAVVVMLTGTAIKYWAVSTDFGDAVVAPVLFGWQVFAVKSQVFYAMLGYAVFGMGTELIGITANKIVVKWFTGHQLALALGLNLAAGRIGTGIVLSGALPYAKYAGAVSAPLALCMVLLVIGLLSFLVFWTMDARADRQVAGGAAEPEEEFRIRDIFSIMRNRGFWYISIMCVLFYSAVFPFMKFTTGFMIQKFGISTSWVGSLVALITFGNILLTPLFGTIYDRRGRGATIMIIGSCMLVVVHTLFSVPMFTAPWLAVALMIMLGAAFSLVPSAMWPSVPKIIPFNQLGTAYGLIFWIQNIGLMMVPMLIGTVLDRYCKIGEIMIDGVATPHYDYSYPMLIFASFGVLSIIFGLLLRREDARKGYGLEMPNIKD